jgi:hypothetical protein
MNLFLKRIQKPLNEHQTLVLFAKTKVAGEGEEEQEEDRKNVDDDELGCQEFCRALFTLKNVSKKKTNEILGINIKSLAKRFILLILILFIIILFILFGIMSFTTQKGTIDSIFYSLMPIGKAFLLSF